MQKCVFQLVKEQLYYVCKIDMKQSSFEQFTFSVNLFQNEANLWFVSIELNENNSHIGDLKNAKNLSIMTVCLQKRVATQSDKKLQSSTEMIWIGFIYVSFFHVSFMIHNGSD